MKRVIRRSVFETNSSSSHSVTFKYKTDDDYNKYAYAVGKTKITDNEQKIAFLLSACHQSMDDSLRAIVNWIKEFNIELDYDVNEWIYDVFSVYDDDDFFNDINECTAITDDILRKTLSPTIQLSGEETREDLLELFIKDGPFSVDIGRVRTYTQAYDTVLGVYSKFTGRRMDKIERTIFNRFGTEFPLCRKFFKEGNFDDCNCGCINLVTNGIGLGKLTEDLLNDKVSMFICESYHY